MSKENAKRPRKPGSWSALRQHLATLDKPALLTLVKDLYEASARNRDFIQARCDIGESSSEILEKYRGTIVEQFYPARGEAKLKLGEARQVIRDYRKATGNVAGTAESLLSGRSQKARRYRQRMIKRTFQLTLVIIAFCSIGATSKALACSCRESGPPCQAYWRWHSVFVGTPLSSSMIEVESDGHKVPQRLFRMRVDEVFQGVSSKRVYVLTGAWGGDCGYDFKIGTKYLIYGGKVTGKPWIATSICSRTRPLSEATEDLRFIRSIPNLSSGATIYGTVTRFNINLNTGTWDPTGQIAGARVTVISGDRKLEHMTSPNGSYRFENLRPGKYIVSLTLPANLSPTNDQNVEIHEHGCAEINYRTVIDGRVEGRLINADGQSPGIKTVDLIPLTNDGKALRQLWAITGADGSFQFKELPAGRYLLAINVDDAPDNDLPYKQTFYPLTEDRSTAEVFSLAEGQHLSGIEFRLPKPLETRQIRGVVVWPDGRPAVGSEVELKHVDSGRSAKWGIKTDKMGQFKLSGFSGVAYKLVATIPADPNWNPDSGRGVELLSSDEVELTSSDAEPVKLVIKQNGDVIRRTKTIVRAPATKPKPKKPRN